MTNTLVDSNVLIDVVTLDPVWGEWSVRALKRANEAGHLYINAIIYAEVSVDFSQVQEVEAVLPQSVFRRLPIPEEVAFLAAKTFVRYRRRGGARTSPLPDFFIGAHAAVEQMRLLTRDSRHYRRYFPTVELIAPD